MKFILLTLVEEMVPPSLVCPVQPTKLLLKRLRPENRSNLELYLSRVLTPTFLGWFELPEIFQLLLLHAHIRAHLEHHRQLVHRVQLLNLGVDHRLGRADVLLADNSHLGGKG